MELDRQLDSAPKVAETVVNAPALNLIAALDEFKGAWRAIGRIRLTVLKRVATDRERCRLDPDRGVKTERPRG